MCYFHYTLLNKYHILGYFRYCNDILIAQIWMRCCPNLKTFHQIQTILELEKNNKLSFLDITHMKHLSYTCFYLLEAQHNDLWFQSTSCHLMEHTLLGIRYLVNRVRGLFPVHKLTSRTVCDVLEWANCLWTYRNAVVLTLNINPFPVSLYGYRLVSRHPPMESGRVCLPSFPQEPCDRGWVLVFWFACWAVVSFGWPSRARDWRRFGVPSLYHADAGRYW